MKGLIFLAGDPPTHDLAIREAQGMGLIIAADGGLISAMKCGITPDIAIGDYDSLPEGILNNFHGEIITLKTDKDETDGQAALATAIERGCDDIVLLGALGGRPDHYIAQMSLLLHASRKHISARIKSGVNSLECFGPGTTIVTGNIGDILSILPLCSDLHIRETCGLKYPVMNGTLPIDGTVGISNVLTAQRAVVNIASGEALFVHTFSKI